MKRKVLFLCTKNSARSQMAEAVLNHRSDDRFVALSAGSSPAEQIHPEVVRLLSKIGFDVSDKSPKSVNLYAKENIDFVITLCDRMKEECPVFPGQPIVAHWGMPDPADVQGTEEEQRAVFSRTLKEISHRINLFLNLPMEKLDRLALEMRVKEIGKS